MPYGQVSISHELEYFEVGTNTINTYSKGDMVFYTSFYQTPIDYNLFKVVIMGVDVDAELETTKLGNQVVPTIEFTDEDDDVWIKTWYIYDNNNLVRSVNLQCEKEYYNQTVKEIEESFTYQELSENQKAEMIVLYYDNELQEVGSADSGYMKVSAAWYPFEDIVPNNSFQYSDLSGFNIVTLDKGVDIVDLEKQAENVYQHTLKDPSAVVVKRVHEVEVNDYDAYSFTVYYTDIYKAMTIYLIDCDNTLYYVSVEGYTYGMFELEDLVETTFHP